jgi:microsomal epoxide hydrolase
MGAGVATRIALRHSNLVIGAHIGDVAERMSRQGDPPPSAQEIAYRQRELAWTRDEGGYSAIQSSKPQTLAYGLADSPVGLAAWILEKFRGWSDCSGDPLSVFPLQMLADNLTIYWMTNTISSSVRSYYDSARLRPPLGMNDFVRVPTAVGMWPKDLGIAPRELAERLYNVERYTVFPRGGHFPAWEEPELYASDLRAFAATLSS